MTTPREDAIAARIIEAATVAIVGLPNSGGVSWNEAHAIAAKVARHALGAEAETPCSCDCDECFIDAERYRREGVAAYLASPVCHGLSAPADPTADLRAAATDAMRYLDTLNRYGATPAPAARDLAVRLRAILAAMRETGR